MCEFPVTEYHLPKLLEHHISDVSFVWLRIDRKSGSNTYDVNMDDAAIVGGGFGYPIEIESKFSLEVL